MLQYSMCFYVLKPYSNIAGASTRLGATREIRRAPRTKCLLYCIFFRIENCALPIHVLSGYVQASKSINVIGKSISVKEGFTAAVDT